ncbi:MAG: hypothetical protein AAGC60_22635 [Acidobacteriota bacterium]
MSTSYYIDLGFDVNAAPISNNNSMVEFTANGEVLYPLQLALVDHTHGDVPAWFTHFVYKERGTQDKLRFRIFDISSGINPTSSPGAASGWTPTDITVFSIMPDGGASAWPFSSANGGSVLQSYPSALSYGPTSLGTPSQVTSPVYGSQQSCWYIGQSSSNHEGLYFRFDTDGQFELSLSLTVQSPDGTEQRLFMADPRMYVGPNSWP